MQDRSDKAGKSGSGKTGKGASPHESSYRKQVVGRFLDAFRPVLVRDIPPPHQYAQFYPSEIRELDEAWIARRRDHFGCSDAVTPTAGLALSGGGVRSATLCMGVLQALARKGRLRCFDFMSTVSGGGYTGACLHWFYHHLGDFPFGKDYMDARGLGGKVLAWLRSRGKYLTPGSGIGVSALISALIGATFINLLFMVPLAIFALSVLDMPTVFSIPVIEQVHEQRFFPDSISSFWLYRSGDSNYAGRLVGFDLVFLYGWATLVVFLLWTMAIALLSGFERTQEQLTQYRMRKLLGKALWIGVVMIMIGALPYVRYVLVSGKLDLIAEAISASGATGLLSIVAGRWLGKGTDESRGLPAWAYRFGLLLLAFAGLVHAHDFVAGRWPAGELLFQPWFYVLLVFIVLGGYFANINNVSMHRYYRNRLMEAYLPEGLVNDADADGFRLATITPDKGAPVPLINTAASMVGSREPVLSQRGAVNFVFSPRYHGSQATNYRQVATNTDGGRRAWDMDLATAMAISGAAVNPNNYFTRSRPLSFFMSLLNVRLGYWFPSPGWHKHRRASWQSLMLNELFGYGLNENSKWLHLSDGGHFENLGVYELIRRRCKYIVAIDAGMDCDRKFVDLARLVKLARVDFGVNIDIDLSPLKPDPETGISRQPFAIGRIEYEGYSDPAAGAGADGNVGDENIQEGHLLYIKSSMLGTRKPELDSYRMQNPRFPHESTADQFFDEQQFEVYRELGYAIGRIARGTTDDAASELKQFWQQLAADIRCD